MMIKFLIFTIFITLSSAYVSYDGYKVYRLSLNSQDKIQAYTEIEQKIQNLNIFGESDFKKSLDVLVEPSNQENFLKELSSHKIHHETYIEDVGELIKETAHVSVGRNAEDFNWIAYHHYDVINSWLDSLAATYPNIVTNFTVGYSLSGAEIKGVKLVFNPSATKVAVVEGGVHAREWITPATTTYILNQLLTSAAPAIRRTAESMIWYFVPVFNPDGYNRTIYEDRMHRKNTQIDETVDCSSYTGGNGIGTDLNRNFGFKWMQGGASSIPCSATYAGHQPFSAPEARALKNLIQKVSDDLVLFLSIHSYSQLLLYPYGHTTNPLDNYYQQYAIGRMAMDALKTVNGTDYTVGNTAEAIYIATGSTSDWVKGTYGTTLSYCMELRDKGQYGFLLPADQIIVTSEEALVSLVVLVEQLFRLDLLENVQGDTVVIEETLPPNDSSKSSIVTISCTPLVLLIFLSSLHFLIGPKM